jgi:gas vesicle protein
MAMNRGVVGWSAALLLALTVAASPVMADEAKSDKSFKQEVKESWQGFKQGVKDTGRAIKDTGKAIKEDVKESAREVKKDLKD